MVDNEQKLLERFMWLSMGATVLTIVLKAAAAWVTGSVGFLSDAIESGINLIAAAVGSPNFDSFAVLTVNGNDVKFGVLLTAIVNFLLIAAAVYFAIVMPMNKMIERRNRRLGIDPAKEEVPEDVALLTEIRDLLATKR